MRDLGGEAILTELSYDAAVRWAAGKAEEHGWWLVQDTAWSGYEQVPRWIMQGYATMAAEADAQLIDAGAEATHLLLQAGVGSMAAAVQSYWSAENGRVPCTVVVEPDQAACFYHSTQAGDGRSHAVVGELATIMAGLACGEPSPLAWPVLSHSAVAFASCPDYVAALGMRLLASPLGNDPRVVAGESGAVGLGLLALLMLQPALAEDRRRLGLGRDATVLIFNTEGATDPENYRRVVWAGSHPVPPDVTWSEGGRA
jgi:diaminopropionate ammonia-lyase